MNDKKHSMQQLKMVSHPDDTFFFDKMPREEKQAVFNTASFFNKQTSGLTTKMLKSDQHLSHLLQTLAVFPGDEDFIAIAEGIEVPLYAFTYNIEMVQFYFEDPNATLDEPMLDHSIIARKHAQYVANMIA